MLTIRPAHPTQFVSARQRPQRASDNQAPAIMSGAYRVKTDVTRERAAGSNDNLPSAICAEHTTEYATTPAVATVQPMNPGLLTTFGIDSVRPRKLRAMIARPNGGRKHDG